MGPPAHAMALMGRKTPAKDAMRRAGLTLVGASPNPIDVTVTAPPPPASPSPGPSPAT